MDIDKELQEFRNFRKKYEPLLEAIMEQKREYDERNAARDAAEREEEERIERERSDAITQKCKDDAAAEHEAILKAEADRLAAEKPPEEPRERETDDAFRARILAVTKVDDKPVVAVATGDDLDKIGASHELVRDPGNIAEDDKTKRSKKKKED